jgi:hypothetical protein
MKSRHPTGLVLTYIFFRLAIAQMHTGPCCAQSIARVVALDIAKKIGVSVAAKAIEGAIGL